MFDSVRVPLEALARDFDASGLSPDGAVRAVRELGEIRRLVDGMLAKAAKRVEDTAAHRYTAERSAAQLVARSLGLATGEVRGVIETASQLEGLPATDQAVREGKLSLRQAQLIAGAASANPAAEEQLLAAAERGLVPLKDACLSARAQVEDQGERSARQKTVRTLRTWTDDDGMLAGRFRLTPEVGGQVKAALDAEVQRIFRAHKGKEHEPHEPHEAYAADAFVGFVLGDTPKGADATVHILIDHAALMRGGAVEDETCEIPGVGPVSVSWVRELLGSAFVTAVIKKGKDILTVAHLGRNIPALLLTALIVSGRECDIEGCHIRGYLERDHTHDYAKGGWTAIWNLRWLCYFHHRLKSSGWVLGRPDPETDKCTLRPPVNARAA